MSYSYNQNIREIEKYNLEQRKKELREQHALAREMRAKQIGGITDADMIYYNILIKNNITGFDANGNPNFINSAIPVVFNESRSQPYLSCASEYYMSVVRFSIDTPALPVFIPQPYQKWTDPSLLIYQVSIVNTFPPPDAGTTVFVASENVVWIPEDSIAPVPTTTPIDYTNYPYYYCYSYQYFINLVNKALSDAYTAAIAGRPGSTYIAPPFLKFEDGIISMVANETQFFNNYDGTVNNNGLAIFFNTSLYNLFSSLTTIKYAEPLLNPKNIPLPIFPFAKSVLNDPTNALGLNYQILNYFDQSSLNVVRIYKNLTSVPITSGASYTAYNCPCDNSPLPTWNPIETIVFTTSLLPVVSEIVGAPVIYGQPYANPYVSVVEPEIIIDPVTFKVTLQYPQSTPDNANILAVLTDFTKQLDSGTELKPSITYTPVSEFRLTDLYDEKPINQLEISVFWKDKFGLLHPFKLGAGGTATIKIMFRKKDV